MRLDRNILREWRELEGWLRPLLAELGAVAFTAAGVFAVIAAAAEFLQPGFVVNFISPRSIVAVLAASGGLALLGAERRGDSRRRRPVYAAAGGLAVFSSFWAAWYYFQPVPEARIQLALAAAAVVAAAFWLPGGADDVPGSEE